jgi:hypothetical protein
MGRAANQIGCLDVFLQQLCDDLLISERTGFNWRQVAGTWSSVGFHGRFKSLFIGGLRIH